MYKYLNAYQMGYDEGIKEAYKSKNNYKKFKHLDDKNILAHLYDIGYICGYNKFTKYIKNTTFNSNKNSV